MQQFKVHRCFKAKYGRSVLVRIISTSKSAGRHGASGLMAASVQGEVVGAGERSVAVLTLERLGPSVFAQVPCQLVRPGEAPVAVHERTAEWLLSCTQCHRPLYSSS